MLSLSKGPSQTLTGNRLLTHTELGQKESDGIVPDRLSRGNCHRPATLARRPGVGRRGAEYNESGRRARVGHTRVRCLTERAVNSRDDLAGVGIRKKQLAASMLPFRARRNRGQAGQCPDGAPVAGGSPIASARETNATLVGTIKRGWQMTSPSPKGKRK